MYEEDKLSSDDSLFLFDSLDLLASFCRIDPLLIFDGGFTSSGGRDPFVAFVFVLSKSRRDCAMLYFKEVAMELIWIRCFTLALICLTWAALLAICSSFDCMSEVITLMFCCLKYIPWVPTISLFYGEWFKLSDCLLFLCSALSR